MLTMFNAAIGKKITEVRLGADDALHFTFDDGSKLKLFDDGQTDSESRYMTTDDNLSEFIGATLLGAEIKPGESIPYDNSPYREERHNIEFLEIQTDRGVLTMTNHNEHNGWYGGFTIRAESESC